MPPKMPRSLGGRKKAKSAPVQEWIVEKGPAKHPTGFIHVQARTKDQLSSFAAVVPPEAELLRGKSVDPKIDIFTLAYSANFLHTTMNVVGKIEYRGF